MSVRISGIVLPEKRVEIALTYVFGVGVNLAREILKKLKIDVNLRPSKLNEKQVAALREEIANLTVEGDLRRKVSGDIKRLSDISCYRGWRHKRKLPVRGQKTKTNAKTRKGKAVPIANKKKVAK
jgi:small subunit ribosomal protein S13